MLYLQGMVQDNEINEKLKNELKWKSGMMVVEESRGVGLIWARPVGT